jgi:hypothetical protein
VPPNEAVPVRCYQQKDGNLLAEFVTRWASSFSSSFVDRRMGHAVVRPRVGPLLISLHTTKALAELLTHSLNLFWAVKELEREKDKKTVSNWKTLIWPILLR